MSESMTTPRPISAKIAMEVADREGVEPTELRPPLHESVDTEALNDLVADPVFQPTDRVEFSYGDYSIRVTGHGTIKIASDTEDR